MASALHGRARTTPRVRAALQEAQASSRAVARQQSLDPKTVLKWRKRTTTADAAMRPAKPRTTTLTEAEEAPVVAFRKRTLLPLDDMLGCLEDSAPKLTRSALHRCLVRNGISRTPEDASSSSKRKTFKNAGIGYVPIDSCELRSAEGKLRMFLAIDRETC
jgi:transposase-like protein